MTTSYQQLQNVQVGNEIVLGDGFQFHPYWLHKVERVTKTQLTVDGKRFKKNSGDMVGSDDWPSKSAIFIVKDFTTGKLLTHKEATTINQVRADRKKCQGLLDQIQEKAKSFHNCKDVTGLEIVLEALNEVK